jgi:hypothetical protein
MSGQVADEDTPINSALAAQVGKPAAPIGAMVRQYAGREHKRPLIQDSPTEIMLRPTRKRQSLEGKIPGT